MELGEIITFGPYQWRVLAIEPKRALLITKDIIGQRPYHHQAGEVSWATSDIRQYLNNEFFTTFTEDERQKILPVVNENPANEWYKTDAGEATLDKIFLLSIKEVAAKYFGDSNRLLYQPAKKQRYWFQRKDINNPLRSAVYQGDIWWWWLRSPGKNQRTAVYIWGNGVIGIQGNGTFNYSSNTIHPQTHDNSGGVRPALWLKLT